MEVSFRRDLTNDTGGRTSVTPDFFLAGKIIGRSRRVHAIKVRDWKTWNAPIIPTRETLDPGIRRQTERRKKKLPAPRQDQEQYCFSLSRQYSLRSDNRRRWSIRSSTDEGGPCNVAVFERLMYRMSSQSQNSHTRFYTSFKPSLDSNVAKPVSNPLRLDPRTFMSVQLLPKAETLSSSRSSRTAV